MSLAYDTGAQGLLRKFDFGTSSAVSPAEFVAHSPAMRKVLDMAAKIGPTDCSVLIEGEPSVGKESVARIIHRQSNRAGGPFVRVPCGGIPKPALRTVIRPNRKRLAEKASHKSEFLDVRQGGHAVSRRHFSTADMGANQTIRYPAGRTAELLRQCGNSVARYTCNSLRCLRPRGRRDLRPLPLKSLLLLEYREDSRAPAAQSSGRYSPPGRARLDVRQLRERHILRRRAASILPRILAVPLAIRLARKHRGIIQPYNPGHSQREFRSDQSG